MAEGATTLKGLRVQMAAAAQAQAEERRSLTGNSPGPTNNTAAKPQGCKPVIDGSTLRIDDRLRVAKERREEADKQHALRESQIMERERKAKLQVERQMEERQKKVEEQRRKEEQRRLAAEEKRKQKQEEEKEHYEAVMRRTLERSRRVEQRQKRWSWGGLSDSDGRTGDSDAGASSPVAIAISPASPEKPPRSGQVDKRSTSTTNLKQPSEAGVNKRLSSSSATLIKFPDKRVKLRSSSCNRLPSNSNAAQASKEDGKKLQVEQTGRSTKMRSSSLTRVSVGKTQTPPKPVKGTPDDQAHRPPANTTDGGFLSRLLTPTQASLARSKSAAALSAEGKDAAAPANAPPPARGPVRSRSIDRQKSGMTTSVSADRALDPSPKDKPITLSGGQRPLSPSTLGRTRSPSPAASSVPKRTPSPSPAKQNTRTRPSSPAPTKQRPPSPQLTAAKPPPIQKPALTPTGPPTLRKRDSKPKDLCPVQAVSPQASDSSKNKDKDDSRASVGTNSAAEAAKILAENRRLMREQKEREEQLRIQREEEEKLRKVEEERLAEEARLKRLEEEEKLAEERRIKEEEEARRAEEDRLRQAEEEAVKQAELQREREEAEAKVQEEAKRVRQERDRIMQQNQQERMQRKKRIEEIMKRTRKGDQDDLKRDPYDDDQCSPENEDDCMEQTDSDSAGQVDDKALEANTDECGLLSGGQVERGDALSGGNRNTEPDNKENNHGVGTDETRAEIPNLVSRHIEGSEFLNEQDSSVGGLVSGFNGKANQWRFEELLDLNAHSKTRPLAEAGDCNQVLIDCDEGPDGTRVAFEDKGAPVNTLHSSNQPIEALSDI